MKRSRTSGATTGLIVVCVLAILALAGGFYGLAMLLGGSKELLSAVDSGVLNTAKQAIDHRFVRVTTTDVGAPDFAALGDRPLGGPDMSLLTYNRAVGQTLLVALNAQAEKTSQAINNANSEVAELKCLGSALKHRILKSGALNLYFDDLAGRNSTKMMGQKSSVEREGEIAGAFARQGAKTNVYFNPVSLPFGANISKLVEVNGIRSSTNEPFIKGYELFDIGLVYGIAGVPVFPQNKPHLVSLDDFTNGAKAPAVYLPPNIFQATAGVTNADNGRAARSVACALVGSLGLDYEASIPRGYIRIHNLNSADIVNGVAPPGDVDGSNWIFNNELFVGVPNPYGGIETNSFVFTTTFQGLSSMIKWIAYASSKGSDPLKHDPKKDPLGVGGSPKIGPNGTPDPNLRFGPGLGQMANRTQLLAMRGMPIHCDHTMYDGTEPDACNNNMSNWISNYGRGFSYSGYGPDGFTNVELMKGLVLDQFGKAVETAIINSPSVPSGMKIWNKNQSYSTPNSHVNFASPGTPWDLLSMAGGCATDWSSKGIAGQLLQRCREIRPKTTQAELEALLRSRILPLNGYFYIFMPAPNMPLVMSTFPPMWGTQNFPPDGAPQNCTDGAYNVRNNFVNTMMGGGAPTGDGNVHQQPYTKFVANLGEITATDTAIWKPGSGYRNFLGELTFQDETQGGGAFSKPN
jgi:hypothetical protein